MKHEFVCTAAAKRMKCKRRSNNGVKDHSSSENARSLGEEHGYSISESGALVMAMMDFPSSIDTSQNAVPGTVIQWMVRASTRARVVNDPEFPARIPEPSHLKLYEVRETKDMGLGLFATSDIKQGDLIFCERPYLVVPAKPPPSDYTYRYPRDWSSNMVQQEMMADWEDSLELAVSRLNAEHWDHFLSLKNSDHHEDGCGPVYGIIRSNGFVLSELYEIGEPCQPYSGIVKTGALLNHSCAPNVIQTFRETSFSLQFSASRDIKTGEQLFYPYCDILQSVSARRRALAKFGVVCRCSACEGATPQRDAFRASFANDLNKYLGMLYPAAQKSENGPDQVVLKMKTLKKIAEGLRKLHSGALREGFEVLPHYGVLLDALVYVHKKMGKIHADEAERYQVMRGAWKRRDELEEKIKERTARYKDLNQMLVRLSEFVNLEELTTSLESGSRGEKGGIASLDESEICAKVLEVMDSFAGDAQADL